MKPSADLLGACRAPAKNPRDAERAKLLRDPVTVLPPGICQGHESMTDWEKPWLRRKPNAAQSRFVVFFSDNGDRY
jgi:hypothetical protein